MVYVSVCATAYARLCSLSNKLYISHRCSWSELDEVCKRLKSFIINLNTDVFEDVQKEEEKERKMRKQFLNIKLLETILLAGNIYNYKGQDELIEKLELKESKDSIISYTLEYYDGELEELVNGGFKVNVSLQTVYVFTKGVVDAFSGNDEFVKKLSGSIGSKVLDGAVAISYGTAVVSLLVSIPTIAAAPFATPLGVVCTVAGSASGALDSNRADKEFKKSVTLYLDSINNNLSMLRMESYLSLYYTISLRVSDLLKANKSIWNRYEQFYLGAKKGQKSRKDWYITKDIHETAEDVPYEMLGKGQTYNISYFDSYLTMKKIRNFNENMKHIKVWNYGDKEYKTISESERMEEFSEISNIEEMITYMKKQNQAGSYYINELDIVGHDKTEKPTKIIYDYGNGEEKILVEKDVIGIVDLFKDNSLR